MQDFNQLLEQFRQRGAHDSQVRALTQLLGSPQGQALTRGLSAGTTAAISRVAEAAQQGDLAGAQAAVQAILRTPDGAQLAAQIKQILGK